METHSKNTSIVFDNFNMPYYMIYNLYLVVDLLKNEMSVHMCIAPLSYYDITLICYQ